MTTTQIQAFTTDQTHVLTTAQIAAFNTDQIKALQTDDMQAFTSTQIAAFTSGQIAALSTTQLRQFDSDDLSALTTAQIAGLTTDHIRSITTDQLPGLETADIAKMNMAQAYAFTSDQVNAMTTDQSNALWLATPIVLDLDGNGINTLAAAQGVNFDLLGHGQTHRWGWVGGNDGLLVMDRNGDGIINDGRELFGAGTVLADGKQGADGFTAMRQEDSNHDGKLDASDLHFKDLRVWVDANHDGKTDAGELKTLADLGIVEMNLSAKTGTEVDNGNVLGLVSDYKTADGSSHALTDVWFAREGGAEGAAAPVSLGDVLAAPSAPVLQEAVSAGGSPAGTPSNGLQVSHLLIAKRPEDDDQQSATPLI
jgi:hypothetical protein